MRIITNIFAFLLVIQAWGQYAPAPPQSQSILIFNATAHLGNGAVIENAAVGFKNGKIEMVADARTLRLSANAYDITIDASGQHLYPGFIAPAINLGLIEMEAVRATSDFYEVGEFNPHIRSLIAYNTDSEILPTIRSNGILLTQVTPRGGIISGTSAVVSLDAWNWEDAVVRNGDGIHMDWPSVYHRSGSGLEHSKNYNLEVNQLQTFFDRATAYCSTAHEEIDPRLEAMCPVIKGTANLYVHAEDERQITEAVKFKKKNKIAHMTIIGGYDAPWVAQLLKDEQVAVMIPRVHSLPRFSGDEINAPFALAKELHDAGVLFCFQNTGDMEAMNARNLPFQAGTAVAHGLPYEKAVQALTLDAAKILGIDQKYGSIEIGKSATFFLSQGDALDMRTNQVLRAFIDGRDITIRNKQEDLYEKYQKKYSLKK
ncbi:MAG: amidohydrolase family protein [Bacteroidetes bacterium]|nr:amidohydrolase family protein [Bacteroidota bacterium]